MKHLFFFVLIGFSGSFFSFGQTTTPSIEIAVDQTIELKVKSVQLLLTVQSVAEQREDLMMENGYFSDYMYSDENDYEYEYLMYTDPKKITKKMEREYNERLEVRMAELEQREAEYYTERLRMESEFVPLTTNQLAEMLKENSIQYKIIENESNGYGEYDEYYYESEYNSSDSVLEITVNSESELDQVKTLIAELAVEWDLGDYTYETSEDQLERVIPELTKKAQSQATILANSLGRKVGKVIEISNIHPNSANANALDSLGLDLDWSDYESEYEYHQNPFDSEKKELIQYVYRFELL